MKSPKTFLLLSVIVAVLVLGVAYAAISNITLTVNGNVLATPDQGNFDVQFVRGSGSQISGSGSGTFTALAQDGKDLSATLEVSGLTTKGQTSVYQIKIANYSDTLGTSLELTETTPSVNDGTGTFAVASEYFDVKATLNKKSLIPETSSWTDEATLTVTITMKKSVVVDKVVGNFTFNITATPTNDTVVS